jgi:isoleucyl-tRNA synthetase
LNAAGAVQDGDKFLVWTTTPWTLTANVAVALNPALTYVRAQSADDVLILSKETAKNALRPGYEILEELSGADLVGLSYSGPFDDLPLQQEMNAATPRHSVAWEDVGEAEGTGIVHIAPGCGAEDYELGKREGLGFLVPVDQSAHFVSSTGEFAGKHALENVDDIFAALETRGRLYRSQRYEHSYPHCWRCDHELIFNAVQEWFIKADSGERPARERLRRAAGEVEWIPEYAGKRMDDWLANMGDWCISRKRFWGLPLPFYLDPETGEVEVIGTRAELRDRAVDPAMVDALPELHRPWIDEIQIRSRDGKRTLRRVPEVGDAWLDAGIVPFSTVGYNGATDIRMPEIRTPKEEWQPVEFITEMREQVRLWFFSMLFMSVALEDRAPYKTAMVYETMLDENGEKISKTKKNGVPYDEAVETVGADPMRWTFCGNTLTKDIRFGYKPIHESARRLLTLWNVYGFFVTYANLDNPSLGTVEIDRTNPLDKWILARLQQVIADVSRAFETYEPALATRTLEAFIEELSTWYVRRSRRRFWKSDSDNDKAAAYATLHHVLLTTSKLLAPIIPFTADSMYRNLSAPLEDAPESVHLCDWPTPDEALRDEALIADVAGVQQAVSLGHSARKDSKIKVRQPLAKVMIQAPTPEMRAAIEEWRDTILEELNVKDLELLDDAGDLVSYSLKANLPKLGKKLGKQMGAVRGVLENASPADARKWGEAARRDESVTIEVNGETLELAPDEILVSTQQSGDVSFASENGWAVALDTQLSPELISEGHARDFIRAIQSARKDAGLEVSDKIAIIVASNTGEAFDAMLENFGDLVQDETLAEELRLVDLDYPELADIALGEETVRFRVEKLTAPIAEENEAAE